MEIFLILINIVLFSSDNIILENRKEVENNQTYYMLFLHRYKVGLGWALRLSGLQFQISKWTIWKRFCQNETKSDHGGFGGFKRALWTVKRRRITENKDQKRSAVKIIEIKSRESNVEKRFGWINKWIKLMWSTQYFGDQFKKLSVFEFMIGEQKCFLAQKS